MKVTLIVLVYHITLCGASIFDWYDRPYGDDSFNTKAEFGTNVTLECRNDRYNDTAKNDVQYWITPDLVILEPGQIRIDPVVEEGDAQWVVSPSGLQLDLILIHDVHFGFYYCVFNDSSTLAVIKKGLNYKGPYFGDLWLKYEMNVIVGCCAVAVAIVLLVIACLIDYFLCPKRSPQYQDPNKQSEQSEEPAEGIDNNSFNHTDAANAVLPQDGVEMHKMKEPPPAYGNLPPAFVRADTHF